MRLTVGITGHRDIAPGEKVRLRKEVRAFFESLQVRFPNLPLELLGALAEGADSLVAEVAVEMGIPFTAVLPMAREEYLVDYDSESAAREFEGLLAKAERIITLPSRPGADLKDQDTRSWHYAQLGVFLSNHCQILLALWDGKDNAALGGTSSVVRYHLTAVMPGFEDEMSAASLLADNENDLAFHIVTGRDRPGGAPADGLEAGKDRWMTSHFHQAEGDDIPTEYGAMLDRLSEFDQDTRRYSNSINKEAYPLLENPPDSPIPPGASMVEHLFMASDWLAIHFQKRVNSSLNAMYSLAVIMGLLFIVYSERTSLTWLLATFLALFFGGVILHLVGDRRQWHRKYLDYRALAEALRVQFYWNVSGVVDPHSPGFAYDTFLHKQDVELGWIRHVMRTASAHRERGVEPSREWLTWTIDSWIGDQQNRTGQLGYYSVKSTRNEVTYRKTQRLGAACLWTGISLAVALLVLGDKLSDEQREVVLILMGLLPLIAGVREAMSNKKAEKELIKQYQFMEKIFGNARQLIEERSDPEFQRRVLKALGEAALGEGAEWILMHRERPIEHGGL